MSACDTAVARLRGRLADRRGLSHAYIVAGPDAAARRELALFLACAHVCTAPEHKRPCMVCPACRKAAQGIHPDVIAVENPDGRDISVPQIRALRADAYVRPNESTRKVYLIDCAGGIHPGAQNALLKVLEEGPDYAAFVLEATHAASLLPTVVSRCELLRLANESDKPDGESEVQAAAASLAGFLLGGDERKLLEYAVTLEKWKRDDLSNLFAAAARTLLDGRLQVKADARRAAKLVAHLQTLERACTANVGAGHLAGWLAAGVER